MATTYYVISDGICIVCSRVSDMATPKVASVRQRCALCYEPIWVARKSPVTWPKVCLPCAKHAGARAMRQPKPERKAQRDRLH